MDPEDDETPITRVVPFLERYARRTQAADGSVFNAIFRYSRSLDVVPDDDSDTLLGRLPPIGVGGRGCWCTGRQAGWRQSRRRALISGLAQIDPKLREALERGRQATSRANQIRVLGTVAQGFRLVEIDQLNSQVRAQHEMKQTASSHGSYASGYGNSLSPTRQ